ncbi:MAG TPA: hypothetical protein VII06_37440 [Chloroflexota bacterium]|jgi:hypothetical protein
MHETYDAQLKDAIAAESLSPLAGEVLYQLATDAYGVDPQAAPDMLASLTYHSASECLQAIADLLSRQLLLQIDTGHDVRIIANYQRLGLDETARQAITRTSLAFEHIGYPHSPKAMSTLAAMFREERGTIYLGLEITSHRVFSELTTRSSYGRKTVFLIPRRSAIEPDRRAHYDEVMNGWIAFLRDGPRSLRQHTRLKLTKWALPHIYTSALSAELARVDLYTLGMNTTRRGQLVSAERGSSLYGIAYEQYRSAVHTAQPVFSIWPKEWLLFKLRGYVLAGFLITLAIPLSIAAGSIGALLAGFILGIASNTAWDSLRGVAWRPPDLFENR